MLSFFPSLAHLVRTPFHASGTSCRRRYGFRAYRAPHIGVSRPSLYASCVVSWHVTTTIRGQRYKCQVYRVFFLNQKNPSKRLRWPQVCSLFNNTLGVMTYTPPPMSHSRPHPGTSRSPPAVLSLTRALRLTSHCACRHTSQTLATLCLLHWEGHQCWIQACTTSLCATAVVWKASSRKRGKNT